MTLAFRDALRTDERTAEEYAELKLSLARQYPRDREAYIDGKSTFVARVLAAAERGVSGRAVSKT